MSNDDVVLVTKASPHTWKLTLNRHERRNALSRAVMTGVERALARAVEEGAALVVIDGGGDGDFCSGMDFTEFVGPDRPSDSRAIHEGYARLLRALASAPLLTLARIDGRATGGGLGLAAACDWVVATRRSRFSMPERLWRLVPAVAGLYVGRRAGRRAAAALALTTEAIGVEAAAARGLVDEIVENAEAADTAVRRLSLRLSRLHVEGARAVRDLLGDLPSAAEEARAVDTITALTDDPGIRAAIDDFVTTGRPPWERA